MPNKKAPTNCSALASCASDATVASDNSNLHYSRPRTDEPASHRCHPAYAPTKTTVAAAKRHKPAAPAPTAATPAGARLATPSVTVARRRGPASQAIATSQPHTAPVPAAPSIAAPTAPSIPSSVARRYGTWLSGGDSQAALVSRAGNAVIKSVDPGFCWQDAGSSSYWVVLGRTGNAASRKLGRRTKLPDLRRGTLAWHRGIDEQ